MYISYGHSEVKLIWSRIRLCDVYVCNWKRFKTIHFDKGNLFRGILKCGLSDISYGHFKVNLVWAHCKEIVNDTTLCCLFLERTSKIYILNINIFILTKEILWGILHWPHFWHFLWSLQGEIERAPKTLKDHLFWQSKPIGK